MSISGNALAAEVRIGTLPAFKKLMEEIAPAFENITGHKVTVYSGLISELRSKIEGAQFDVIISTAALSAYLSKENRTIESNRTNFARAGIGAAVRSGAPKPDISTVEAFKSALLAARSISIPTKESTAGAYLVELMEKLGVLEAVKSKLLVSTGGGQTPKAVASGEAEIGLSLLNEFVPVRGLAVLGFIPTELQRYVVGTAGVSVTAKEPSAATKFIQFLGTPAAIAKIKADGLETIE
jgi:molybdate transport system substrate-binding protein